MCTLIPNPTDVIDFLIKAITRTVKKKTKECLSLDNFNIVEGKF